MTHSSPRDEPEPGKTSRYRDSEGATTSYRPRGSSGGRSPDLDHCHLPAELANHPRYQMMELLGAGGMGCVYKARHRVMDRLVALKVINRGLLDRPAMIDRFLQEVRTAARLAHPNIVRAYDADQAGDNHFLVMEYVAGENLDQVLSEQGRFAISQACDYARQVALGLAHAHGHGMVHRDIKPHNLMLTAEEQIKILDFGLARYVSEVAGPHYPAADVTPSPPTAEHVAPGATVQVSHGSTPKRPFGVDPVYTYPAIGTPDYLAPEEILDACRADIRADIYSLGCTLYRFLTGEVPFPGGTIKDKLRGHLGRSPVPLAEVRPDVPPELARVVERMMAKELIHRYQTPAEVVQALAPFTRSARQHVLVVDDDPVVRGAVQLTLEGEGYGVTCAGNGREALDRLRGGPRPDLILLDLVMPVMDGWRLLYVLQHEPALAEIPVMILSAQKRNGRAAGLGTVAYLEKPLPLETVALEVKHHMGQAG